VSVPLAVRQLRACLWPLPDAAAAERRKQNWFRPQAIFRINIQPNRNLGKYSAQFTPTRTGIVALQAFQP